MCAQKGVYIMLLKNARTKFSLLLKIFEETNITDFNFRLLVI